MADDDSSPEWELDRAAFDRLLAALHPDRSQAGDEYEKLRRRLIVIFAARKCPWPDRVVDEALDRAARMLEAEDIRDIRAFAYRVATNVFHELERAPDTKATPLTGVEHAPRIEQSEPDPAERVREQREECLNDCWPSLAADDRTLLLEYDRGQKGDRIRRRQQMARDRDISLDTLRKRVERVRTRLRECINNCVGRMPAVMDSRASH